MPGSGSAPFREVEMTDEQVQKAYYNSHDLREMYTRDNTERRRAGAHTLRKFLTQPQDKALTAKMVKIRAEYEVANNDDVVIVFIQDLIAQGKESEVDPKLAETCKKATVAKRTTPLS